MPASLSLGPLPPPNSPGTREACLAATAESVDGFRICSVVVLNRRRWRFVANHWILLQERLPSATFKLEVQAVVYERIKFIGSVPEIKSQHRHAVYSIGRRVVIQL